MPPMPEQGRASLDDDDKQNSNDDDDDDGDDDDGLDDSQSSRVSGFCSFRLLRPIYTISLRPTR